jgi:hypothetical protein
MAQSCCRCDDRWPRGENSRRPWPQMSLASAGLLARAKTVHWRCSRLRSDTHRPNHCRAQRLRGEAHSRPPEPAARCGFSSAAQSVRRCRLDNDRPKPPSLYTADSRTTAPVWVFGRRRHERCSWSGGRRPKSAKARSRGEVWAAGCNQRYGDLIFTPVMVVGGELAPGDLDRVWSGPGSAQQGSRWWRGAYQRGGRLVDWRDCAESDRRQRGASATERESGGAHGRSGS